MLPMHFIFYLGLACQLVGAQRPSTPLTNLTSLNLNQRVDEKNMVPSCPELYGNEPMPCSNPACGGENDTKKVCKQRSSSGEVCQCKDAPSESAPPAPENTVVTATDSAGSTLVGTFELQTLTMYTSLKEEATITVTQTTTDANGKTGVETAAAVVAAGGVAWFLGYAGDVAGAGALITEAPAPPESNPDDPSCPTEHNKCNDCGGKIGFCVTKDPGCACEEDDEKECPSGDKMPKCDDDTCGGKDEKCTKGDHKDCACTPGPKCPAARYTPYCDYCGDKDDDGKCKGLADKKNLWKGCDCWDEPANPPAWPDTNQDALNFDPDSLPTESIETYSYGGDDPLKCQDLEWSAPKDRLERTIGNWCKSHDGSKIERKSGNGTIFERFDNYGSSYWLAATLDDSQGDDCDNSAEITEINCYSTLQEMLDFCNIGQSEFKGGELTDGCVKYRLTFSDSKIDDDLPWDPLPPSQQAPTCPNDKAEISEVPSMVFGGIARGFCDQVDKDPTKKLEKTLTTKDFQGFKPNPSPFGPLPPINIGKRIPIDMKPYESYTFDFKWEGNSDDKHCVRTCSQTADAFVSSCGKFGDDETSMQQSAEYDSGCGKYSYAINEPPPKYSTEPICGRGHDLVYPFFDTALEKEVPTPDEDIYSKLCTFFANDDVHTRDAVNYAYGHWKDFGVYLNYNVIENGAACPSTDSTKAFSVPDCEKAVAKIYPTCKDEESDDKEKYYGGTITYRCYLYSLQFRNWGKADPPTVDL